MRAYLLGVEEQTDLLKFTAWINARLVRARRMPSLKEMMQGKSGTKVLKGKSLEKATRQHEERTGRMLAALRDRGVPGLPPAEREAVK